jgi:predicted PurR-regulated permease PerM
MISLTDLPSIERIVLVSAGCVVILAGIKMAAWFIGPLLLSTFIAIIFSVLANWLMKKGFSPGIANMIAFSSFILCMVVFAALVILSLSPLVDQYPEIYKGIEKNVQILQVAANNAGVNSLHFVPSEEPLGGSFDISRLNIPGIFEGVSALLIVIFTTLLLLLEASGFSHKFRRVLLAHPEFLGKMEIFSEILIEYVVIRTKVNLFTGLTFGGSLLFFGIEGALLWGLILFVLSYVPYIGFILAVVPPVLLAFIQISPETALFIVIVACLINLFAENFLFPQFAGRGMNLSPAVIFISILFWGFMFGASGALIAVPLTVLLKMIIENFPETRWLSMLMGPDITIHHEELPVSKDEDNIL